MVTDRPDYTLPVSIIAQEIAELDVNITAADIGNLNVIIAGQVGNLDVRIAAQVGNINVNIAAQSGNVTISVNAQTVGVYLMPEWAAKTAVDKNFVGGVQLTSGGLGGGNLYTVPAGKLLFISDISFYRQTDAGNVALELTWAGDTWIVAGGTQGGSMSLTKPKTIAAGNTLAYQFRNVGATTSWFLVCIGGYEISV